MPSSPIRKLAPLANEAKARGVKVYHLNIGQPDIPTPQKALDALKEKYALAIVSNKPDPAVKMLCAKYFPGIYARGVSEDCPRKPAPDMVLQTLKRLLFK